jgi:hypothetical protein
MESERGFENKKEEIDRIKNVVRTIFDNFGKRSDEPGEFIVDIKDQLIEQSKTDPKALERLEKNKNSKYRANALFAPLAAIELFLVSDESQNLPEAVKQELNQKMERARKDISEKRGMKLTKNEVFQVEELVKEVEKYL